MSKNLFHISITESELAPPSPEPNVEDGSLLTFSGVVRGTENDKPIEGIDYKAYLPMAEKEMRKIGDEGRERFPGHGLWMEHRIGFVPAGEPSLFILVATPHSAEGFEISRWYLEQVKTRLPIWKEVRIANSPESKVRT